MRFWPDMRPSVVLSVPALCLACAKPATPATPPSVAPEFAAEVASRNDRADATPAEVSPAEPTAEPAASSTPTYTQPADWPSAVVFPTAFNPARASISSGPAGDVRLEHNVEHGDVAAIGAEWTRALAARGFVPREPCVEAPSFACIYVGDGRLAVLDASLARDNMSTNVALQLLPIGHEPLARLPGPCVTPPVRHREITVHESAIDDEGERRESMVRWALDNNLGPDLDGDGRPEIYVPSADAGECPWDIPHDVYVMRGACGHRIGTVVGPVDVATYTNAFHRGLRIVDTVARWARRGGTRSIPWHHTLPRHHPRKRQYVFNGKRLVLRRDDGKIGDCHHCSVAYRIEG